MKRILVYGMTGNRGGIESYLINYYRVLVKQGIVFDFITEHQPMAYADEVQKFGSKIYYIPSRRCGILKHMKAVRSVIKEHKEYDKVYFNILSASEVFTVLATVGLKGVKRFVHGHNNNVKSVVRNCVLRPLLSLISDVKLACSNEAAEFTFGKKSYMRKEVTVVTNAIHTGDFSYSALTREKVRMSMGFSEDMFVIGHVGRLCYQKNTLFLLQIFRDISVNDDKAVLLLVGEGEDREIVEKTIKQYGIEDKVILTGMRDDVNELMQAMDVFVFPSRFEGLGIVLIEAQTSGMHCFTSDKVVPQAVAATELVHFIDLGCKAKEWADAIRKEKNAKRVSRADSVREAGYDVLTEARKIKKILEG